MTEKTVSTVITLGPGLIRWPHLFVPHAGQVGWAERYGCTIILDAKKDADQIRKALELAGVAMRAGFGEKANWLALGGKIVCPIEDGSSSTQDGCGPGTIMIAAYSRPDAGRPNNNAPIVIGRRMEPILDKDAVYDGMQGYIAVDFYVSKGYSRVNVGLKAVQKYADGPRLGNVLNPKAVFKSHDLPEDDGGDAEEPAPAKGSKVDPMAALGLR